MKKLSVKVISLLLAASMLGSLAACKKNKEKDINNNDTSHSGQKITEDTPWFDSKITDVEIDVDSSREVDSTYQQLIGADDKIVILFTGGQYKMPPDDQINWETFDYSEYSFNQISIIDRASGKSINKIDLSKAFGENEYFDHAVYENGMIIASLFVYDENTYESMNKTVEIDPATGKVSDSSSGDDSDDNMNIERTFKLGDYKVDTEMVWEERSSYILYITAPDGHKTTVEVKKAGEDYYDIPVVLLKDEKTAVVPVNKGGNGDYVFFEMDLQSGNLTEADAGAYEWLDLEFCYNPFTGSDGSVYFSTPVGITKINFKEKCMEAVFNYSWCGVNRNILSNLQIAEINEDSFVLCGDSYNSNAYASNNISNFTIVEFTKAAKNPNAGKYILELYSSYGYTSDKISDAILKFNETNSEYFIEVTDRYSKFDDADYRDINSDDDYEQIQLGSDAKMSNQLAMDILNGEGPDILMNVCTYGQLNNDNYLADLTPYVGSLDPEKYFTNVIDSSKVNGKLYNLPICFVVEGIQTDARNAGASGVGFTTDEYEKFLKSQLNGKDVITSGQAFYFVKLYTAMSDKFVKDGKIDFSGPEFEQLAEYVKNNVPEKARSWDEGNDMDPSFAVGATIMKGDMPLDQTGPAIYTRCYGLSTYFYSMYECQGGTAILGLPSSDGRGPVVSPYISVAISAQAYNVDACGEFVKMLLSDEVQTDFAMMDNFVISREAFREAGKKAVEYYGGEGADHISYGNPDDHIKFTEKNVEDMENIVLSCSSCNVADAAINLILIEEMPAYFSGQKPLSEVIAIAQDRAQKVMDERG